MRKRNVSVQNRSKRRYGVGRIAALILLFFWLLLAALWYIEDRFDPILDELAEYEAQSAVAEAITVAVSTAGQQDPALYQGLYHTEYAADGSIQGIYTDAAAMNHTRLALVDAVALALHAIPERVTYISFGTLTGFSLLNRLGPGWILVIQPDAYVEGEIEETVETVAINCTRYAATLVLRVTINMVLDGQNRVLHMTSRVPLASLLVDGATPLYYGGA